MSPGPAPNARPTGAEADPRKPVLVDNRDGNTLARAISAHLRAPQREDRPPEGLCVASWNLNPQGLELRAPRPRSRPPS